MIIPCLAMGVICPKCFFFHQVVSHKKLHLPNHFCDIKFPLLKEIGDWGQAIQSERLIENAITKLSLGCFGIFMGLEICYHGGELQSLIT